MSDAKVVVLGTGMAGFGAAYRLHAEGIAPVMYDKNSYHGGHTASFRFESGFLFDLGPHISFTKDPRIQELFADSVDQQYETLRIDLNNYWRGYWPKHPVQVNLHGLPDDVVVKCITDFLDARQAPEPPIANYEDWLLSSFGRTLAELFPMQYTRKYHTTSADNMSTDWLGPRIYRPKVEEVLRGAISKAVQDVHYISHFRYPRYDGFVSYLKKFVPLGNIKLGSQLVSVDPRQRRLSFSNGHTTSFDALISSVPLPDLIPMIQGAPQDVVDAAQRLACTTVVLVNVGINREDISSSHLTYIYDEDVCFTRLSYPHMLSATNVPPGAGSIQAELYFSDKYKPLAVSPESLIEPVVRDLRRIGLIKDNDQVLFRQATMLRYANIIFDLDRAAALKTVHGYLDDLGIRYCGRYGDWGYMWTDESFKSGESAAQKALEGTLSSKAVS